MTEFCKDGSQSSVEACASGLLSPWGAVRDEPGAMASERRTFPLVAKRHGALEVNSFCLSNHLLTEKLQATTATFQEASSKR
jgi:hypothetical protein